MTPGDQTSRDARVDAGAPTAPAARATFAPATPDFWLAARRVLRGRLRLVIALTCLGAAAGAAVGLSLGKRLFLATGLVRIASALPPVMKETDQNRPMANFDGFIQAQREVMTGRDTIDAAFQEEAWKKLRAQRRTPTMEEFSAGLRVDTRQRSDFLQVKFTHKDPTVAATAVQAIIAAYQAGFTREQERTERARTEVLESKRAALNAELARLESQVTPVSRGRTLTEIDPLCQEVSDRIRKLRGALTDVQVAIAGGPELAPRQWERADQAADPSGDPRSWYTAELGRLERELFAATTAGLRSAHPTVMRLETAIQACRTKLASLPAPAPTTDPAASAAVTSARILQERETSLRTLLQSAQDEMRALAAEREQVKRNEEQAAVIRQQLTDTNSRIDALATEASAGSRLMVVSGGNRPMTAMLDNRMKMAAVCSLAGAMLPSSLMVLAGLLRRRYRSGEELAEDLAHHVPFVAVLPDVQGPGALGMMAARCVHDIRARLAPRGPREPRVYLVASASPDEGKGALAMALGFSFAAVGIRTVIVDGDLTSRGVSMSFGAADSLGLAEAISGQEPFVQRVRNGPWVLSSGLSTARDACKLDSASLRRVLASLRDRFDVVLVVGDPILTGITASVIAPQTDGVILAVANGQKPQHVRQAVRQMEMQGTTLSVAVFNKADPSELPIDIKAREAAEKTKKRTWPAKVRALGPLVANVLSSLQHTRDEDVELTSGDMELARTDRGQRETTSQDGARSHEAPERRARDAA